MSANMARIRAIKKSDKPRPLHITTAPTRISGMETRLSTAEDIMALTDLVASNIANGNYDSQVKNNIQSLHGVLKLYGSKMEAIYKDQLDRNFVSFRNGSRDDGLDYSSRVLLLELIELRATKWSQQDNNGYYKYKSDFDAFTPNADIYLQSPSFTSVPISPESIVPVPQQLILGPGEVVKSSGKFPAPTRVVGKNYCKDEIVIRNSDSGKVMGIRGRRVHMIEELSETVVSFQRVNPGAKERLVQITGPTENKINFAKQLVEDTIRRNASPVMNDGDPERPASNSSLTDSEDNVQPAAGTRALKHSFSTNDASLGEYKYTVSVGDENIKITGANLDLVKIAKLVLDEYFSPDVGGLKDVSEDGETFEHIEPYPPSQPIFADVNRAGFANDPKMDGSISVLQKGMMDPRPSSAGGIHHYTPEEIIFYLDSPLSRQVLDSWAAVIKEYPSLLRKTPIEWYDAASVLKNLRERRKSPEKTRETSPPGSASCPILVE